MNPQMFNSFLDGTKSGIEMAAVANATGLARRRAEGSASRPAVRMSWPSCCVRVMPARCTRGQVEVISSPAPRRQPGRERSALGRLRRLRGAERLRRALLPRIRRRHRPDRPDFGALPAVPSDRTGAECLRPVGRAARRGDRRRRRLSRRRGRDRQARFARGRGAGRRGRRLRLGQAVPAADSLRAGGLPIGLANGVKLVRDVPEGAPSPGMTCGSIRRTQRYRFRRAMEAGCAV